MKCPYCGGSLKERVEFKRLSVKRRRVLDAIVAAGPEGILYRDLKERFFKDNSHTTVRTTLYQIRKAIDPLGIDCTGTVIRLT